MLSSSASRRDAARSGELQRPPAPSGMSRSGELPTRGASAGPGPGPAPAAVRHEGWLVRHGRRKIGRSFFHMRYFVLDNKLLAYYKKKPRDGMIPLKSIIIDGNCRVEDRGLKTHHGQMGAYDIEDALVWKRKLEILIDQVQPEDEEEPRPTLLRRTTIGNGPPDSVLDWTKEPDIGLSRLRIFEELVEIEYLARSCSRAMRAVGVVEASCEAIFGLVMGMDVTRYEWDCSFQYGSLVEEVDGHTAILYHRLQLNWLVWPRDLCYVRYWRRNDDGSYGLREYFAQTDEVHPVPRIPVMHAMVNAVPMKEDEKLQELDMKTKQTDNKILDMVDEESEDDDDYQVPGANLEEEPTKTDSDAKSSGYAGKFTMILQIPGPSHYSLVLYFVSSSLKKGSLLQRFADGDDDFRNSRLKLIPSVPKGSWIVRQSVGSTPCLLGKAVDCSYMRGPEYLEVDVDIGSSAVANGVLGLVFGVVTTLVVDMAFLIQANTYDELPEQLLGAARLSNIEPSSAVNPELDNIS
nr:unnamed protein product [Digitaria exilis]